MDELIENEGCVTFDGRLFFLAVEVERTSKKGDVQVENVSQLIKSGSYCSEWIIYSGMILKKIFNIK